MTSTSPHAGAAPPSDAAHTVAVRPLRADDLPAVCRIVNHYIRSTTIHFGTTEQEPQEWVERWEAGREWYPWLGAVDGDRVLGIAYAARWNARQAYAWAAESTIYLAPEVRRRGIGRALYAELFRVLDAQGYRVTMAGIALPNEASVGLHRASGFVPAGTLRGVGWKLGRWIDVAWFQRVAPGGDAAPTEVLRVADVAN